MSGTEKPVALLVAPAGDLAQAIVARLTGDGFHVIAAGGAQAPESHPLDPRDEAGWEALVADIVARHGRVAAVINAAGHGMVAPVEATTPADFRALWEANVETAVIGTKWAFRLLRDTASGGSVVNLASLAGVRPRADAAAWSAADAAVTHFSKIAAVEAGDLVPPCRVNSVNPGDVAPDQVAAAIAWLAGPQSRFVTGTVLVLSGESHAR
jgi:NAD(P)-dependent dehydrogenase (short-subunit alcohol dehydrogenase family)